MTRILIFIFLVMPFRYNFAQEGGTPVIKLVETKFVDYKKELAYWTTFEHYRIIGYKFAVRLCLSITERKKTQKSPYGIVCVLPDNFVLKLSIDQRKLIEVSADEFEYEFLIETHEQGWLKVMLASLEEMQNNADPEFYKNRSNTRLVYLRPPLIKN